MKEILNFQAVKDLKVALQLFFFSDVYTLRHT